MSGLESTLTAAIIGGCVGLISSLISIIKFKKTLKQCLADSNCTNTFVYKNNTYSKDKYITIKKDEFKSLSKGKLAKMISSYQKSHAKGKLNEIQILDLNALELALNEK